MSGQQNFFSQLWPKENASKRKLSPVSGNAARVKIKGVAAPVLAGGSEPINIGFVGTLLPPTDISLFKFKIDIAGQWKLVAGAPAASNQVELANELDINELYSFVGKYQKEIGRGVSFEGQAAFGSEFLTKYNQAGLKHAIASAVSARLKMSGNVFPGQDAIQWGAEVDLSPDVCPFGITLKLVFQTPPAELQSAFPSLPKGLNVQLEGAARIGIGLSQRGWIRLLQLVGDQSLRQVVSSLGQQSVKRILLSQLGAASAAAAGGAAIGAAGFYFGMAWLAATASKGKRLGILRNYCLGYVTAIFESRPGYQGHLTKMKLGGSRETDRHFQGGYKDGKDTVAKKESTIEETLIKKFPVYRMTGSSWWRYQKQVDIGPTIDSEEEVKLIADSLADFLVSNKSAVSQFLDLSDADWSW
jgi:hypothetical protein